MKVQLKVLSLMVVAVLLLNLLLPGTVQAKEYTIKDVQQSDEAYQTVQDVLNQGWMSLVLGKFFPDKYITRAEFTLILTKFNGQLSEASKIKKVSFKDVKLKDQYGKYIELQKKYITYYKTKDGSYFKPKNYLTREDALVAIVKALGYDTDEAVEEGADSEIDLSEFIEDYNKISPALKNLVTLGVTNQLIDLQETGDKTYLNPKKNITRRQMAMLLANAQNSKEIIKEDSSGDEITTDDSSGDDEDTVTSSNSGSNTAGNSDDSKDTSSSSKSDSGTKGSTVENDIGHINIDINGKQMNFKAKTESVLGDYIMFYSDKYSSNNSFAIKLPTDISSGDTITIDSTAEFDLFRSFSMDVQYTNSKGEDYIFGYPLGHGGDGVHSSSKFIISITENQGKGGYVSGTMNGELVLEDGEAVTFSNGEFKFKLKGSDF